MDPRLARNEYIIRAYFDAQLPIPLIAEQTGLSTRWVHTLLSRYTQQGPEGLHPQSRRPHTTPNATPAHIVKAIIDLHLHLKNTGLDSGPGSIYQRLDPQTRPSLSTIYRILKRHGHTKKQPHKRPRSSWRRFQAQAPNQMWQSDFTHWKLADGTDVEIITWLDDHSRFILHTSAHTAITTPIVIDTFTQAATTHGLPASTLTDNGMVYTTRLAAGNHHNSQPNHFEQLLATLHITQINSTPNHPTTQGKIERWHQTLKTYLRQQPTPTTITQLQHQLNTFTHLYNHTRPHRALAGKTPHHAYTTTPKDAPTITLDTTIYRIRYDHVDPNGRTTLRWAGKIRHLGIGRTHKHQPILILTHNNHTIVIHKDTGEILAEHTLTHTRDYHPKNT